MRLLISQQHTDCMLATASLRASVSPQAMISSSLSYLRPPYLSILVAERSQVLLHLLVALAALDSDGALSNRWQYLLKRGHIDLQHKKREKKGTINELNFATVSATIFLFFVPFLLSRGG